MKHAFVTGANGFVGSHLVDRLLKEGFEVTCLVRKTSNLRWLENKPVQLHYGSLNDKNSLIEGIKNCNFVYHVAGVLFGRNRESFFKGNVDGTRNLLEACVESGQSFERLLYVGTQAVAGPSPNGEPINEDSECHPLTWYGESKLETERLVVSYMDRLPITVIRPGAVYGPRDYAIFEVFKTSLSGINMRIGSGDKYVSFIHVEDLVEGIYRGSISDKSKSEIYFIVNDEASKQDEIARQAILTFGKKVKSISIPVFLIKFIGFVGDIFAKLLRKDVVLNGQKVIEITQDYWVCSNAKAKKDLNFNPKWSIEDGVKMTAEWYKSNGWLKY